MKRLITFVSVLLLLGIIGFAQNGEPKPIVKAFPPQLSSKFDDAQKNLVLAQSQLQAAQANYKAVESQVRLLLYEVADDIGLTKEEKQTCPYAQVQSGAWVFNCPAPKSAEKAKSTP